MGMKKKEINYQLLIRRICLIVLDIICIIAASILALLTRFEFDFSQIPKEFLKVIYKYGPFTIVITLIIFTLFRIYSSLWEYAGIEEVFSLIAACLAAAVAKLVIISFTWSVMPRSWYVLDTIYLMILIGATRVSYRLIRLRRQNRTFPWSKRKKVMIIGGGEAGRSLITEIQNSKYLDQKVVCIIDDDPYKIGRYIKGVKVVGNRNSIKKSVKKYNVQQIILTIPSANAAKIRPIVEICQDTNCELMILPGVYQLVNGEVRASKLRPVNIDDLLGRDEVYVNLNEVMDYVSGRVIMVTGGGGSIGSELCRQIAKHSPKQLIIFDIYENNAYDIQQELLREQPKLDLVVLIGSVRDENRINSIFEQYRPEIIYHAAAHKHVPLMEGSPNEAIKNNVLGTYNMVRMADKWNVKRFVQISTDKAVNPTNIMGASKRICEMIIQTYNKESNTEYVAVRFGNVLGSNGSVIPLFKKQIAEGGPVTVTHPEIIRYFMTIPEAVSLVLQAGTYAKGGEIFVLDMGDGTQKIKISYAGTDAYSGASAEATVNIGIGREKSVIEFKKNPTIKLVYNDDLTVDYAAAKEAIMNDVIDVEKSSPEGLSLDNLTIEYYATATTGAAMGFGNAWAPIEGGKINGLTYPGIPEGTQKIRVTYAGDKENTAVTAETDITVIDREQSAFNLNEPAEGAASYEVPMAFNEDQTYDYDATAKAIYNAVVASTVPENLTADDVTIRYNAGIDKIKNWQPLNTTDWTSTFTKFGPGEWTIQFSWAGNKEYKGVTTEVKVNVTDNRLASAIVCKEGVSFTYNMDAAVMKQAIFDNVIDWENSTLPAKDTLTVDNFTMEYFGSNTLAGDIDGGVKQWAPIEGGTVTLLTYARMGAGEQKIRITYKGNAQYRPSAQTESTVTVNKAKVKVKVKSTSIYADATLPEDFVTMNPADKFDVYTVYGGLTSNANLSLYLDLPDKYTNSAVLKLLDPIVEKLYGKTFTQMMNDGMTVGELRQLLSTQELLDLLEKLHIDTGTFGQILTIINKMPSVADSVRVSFGTPNHAGLYTVTAVTDSKNYETGVGIGTLLVKMRSKGVKLNWNARFVNGKITAEEAKNFDFKATLSADGDVTIAQDNVHYLYSGFTSKWKIYSSTTTPPTEPGSYVMTVVTLGGDYQAAPIKRGFKITK